MPSAIRGSRLVLALGIISATPVAVAAQRADSLPIGARVRATLVDPPAAVLKGTLVRFDRDSLAIAEAGTRPPRVVALNTVLRLDTSNGSRPPGEAFGRGATRGVLVGLAVSAVAMGAAVIDNRRNPCNDCMITGPVVAGVFGIAFTSVATLVGGALGRADREQWTAFPIR
jgi:hypothetical protein